MLHFALPTERHQAAPVALPPVTPAAYLRLRREAAGLSVAAAARRLIGGHSFEQAARVIRQLEAKGVTARDRETVIGLAEAFPLDPDVYMQLCGAPAHQHPSICRGCGCTEWDPSVSTDGDHRCGWASRTTYTRCDEASDTPGAAMTGVPPPEARDAGERRMARILVVVALVIIWVPIAVVMLVAGMSDRLR